ncbi:DUF3955 domain-containing protein [Synechococcus sp. CS-1329]|uniref:DUF3955 domain-containing protein n=1 Tax=Synechococcus sp. CS-1329 TaxID=2847975 RepID=UPI00223BE072|nr:DUF3955 domain-containing protein [Synechococcus sp. CS-1329]MCT0219444.1 DUF3955 domain-containing protein [Synechococcus sp. CS-1329]
MKRPLIRLALLLLTGAVVCAVAYRLIGVRVEADGTLSEAFALIPIGYFLGGAGIGTGIAGLLWRKPAKRR